MGTPDREIQVFAPGMLDSRRSRWTVETVDPDYVTPGVNPVTCQARVTDAATPHHRAINLHEGAHVTQSPKIVPGAFAKSLRAPLEWVTGIEEMRVNAYVRSLSPETDALIRDHLHPELEEWGPRNWNGFSRILQMENALGFGGGLTPKAEAVYRASADPGVVSVVDRIAEWIQESHALPTPEARQRFVYSRAVPLLRKWKRAVHEPEPTPDPKLPSALSRRQVEQKLEEGIRLGTEAQQAQQKAEIKAEQRIEEALRRVAESERHEGRQIGSDRVRFQEPDEPLVLQLPRPVGQIPWCSMEITDLTLGEGVDRVRLRSDVGYREDLSAEGPELADPVALRLGEPGWSRERWAQASGGTMLLDASGSMSIPTDTLAELLQEAPDTRIAIYAACGQRSDLGELAIVSRNGRIATQRQVHVWRMRAGGGNGVDGPALLWLGRQSEPRTWVCDGVVTGTNDRTGEGMREECAASCRRFRIEHVNPERGILDYLRERKITAKARARRMRKGS